MSSEVSIVWRKQMTEQEWIDASDLRAMNVAVAALRMCLHPKAGEAMKVLQPAIGDLYRKAGGYMDDGETTCQHN